MNGTGEDLEYHWIALSMTDYDGELNPEVGDEIVHLGHRYDTNPDRQTAIVISSYTNIEEAYWTDNNGKHIERLKAPFICQYRGINNFQLIPHRWTYWAANGNTIRGNLLVESGQSVEDVATRVDSTSVMYAISESGTKPPTVGWSTSIPDVPEGYFLWCRTIVSYSNGETSTSYTVSKNGSDGADGKNGEDGKDGADGKDGSMSFNLLDGTKNYEGNWINVNNWTKLAVTYNGLDVMSKAWNGTTNYLYAPAVQIEKGEVYTFSVWMKAATSGALANIGATLSTVLSIDSSPYTNIILTNDWKRYSFKCTGKADGTAMIGVASSYGTIQVCGYKLEIGDVSETIWSPSWNDLQGKDGADGKDGKDGTVGKDGADFTFNLLNGSANWTGDNWPNTSSWYTSTAYPSYNGCKVLYGGQTNYPLSFEYNVTSGYVYTFSCYLRTVGSGWAQFKTYSATYSPYISPNAETNITTNGEWIRYQITFTALKTGLLKAGIAGGSGNVYLAGYKLEAGEVESTQWAPSKKDLATVSYRLVPRVEYALIDPEGDLKVNFDYTLQKVVGDEVTAVKPSDEGLVAYWTCDLDWGDEHYFDDSSNIKYVNDRFLHGTYKGTPYVDPQEFRVFLEDTRTGQIIETRCINVQFEAYAILSLTDSILTRVRNNEGRLSQFEQTAEQFSFDLYDPDGAVGSKLEIATDKIMQKVNENYTELSSRGFEINANTVVNGSLTLNDASQGFLLNGSGGQTLISPQSIGTYQSFTNKNTITNTFYSKNNYGYYMGNNLQSTVFVDSIDVGYIDYNQQVTFLWDANCNRYQGSNSPSTGGVPTGMSKYFNYVRIYYGNTLYRTFTNQQSFSFSTPAAANYRVELSYYFDNTNHTSFSNPIAYISTYVQTNIPRNGIYTLIGYDGIATAFGNGRYLYFGPSETQINYGGYGLRITNTGVQIGKNGTWSNL